MNEKTKQIMWHGFVDHLKAISTMVVAISIIIAAGVAFLNWSKGGLQEALGTTEILQSVNGNAAQLTEQAAQLTRQDQKLEGIKTNVVQLQTRVDEIAPKRVAEYDDVRSGIAGPCGVGEQCNATFRVRRTADGTSCQAPNIARVFVDAAGVTHYPPNEPPLIPRRVTDEWSSVVVPFVVPTQSVTGKGEYFLELDYRGCDWTERVEERTIPLLVDIKNGDP